MKTHDCPGLIDCYRHPKWSVVILDSVSSPYGTYALVPPYLTRSVRCFRDHTQAMRVAQHRAAMKEATR